MIEDEGPDSRKLFRGHCWFSVIVVMLATHFALGPVFVPAIVIMLTLEVADVAGVLLGEMIVAGNSS